MQCCHRVGRRSTASEAEINRVLISARHVASFLLMLYAQTPFVRIVVDLLVFFVQQVAQVQFDYNYQRRWFAIANVAPYV